MRCVWTSVHPSRRSERAAGDITATVVSINVVHKLHIMRRMLLQQVLLLVAYRC